MNALSTCTAISILMLLKGGGQRGGTIGRGKGLKNTHIHKAPFRSAIPKPICCNIQARSLLSVGNGKGEIVRVMGCSTNRVNPPYLLDLCYILELCCTAVLFEVSHPQMVSTAPYFLPILMRPYLRYSYPSQCT